MSKQTNYDQRNPQQAKERKNRWRLKNAAIVIEWLEDYKRSHPCPCGEDDIVCLAFHHRGGKEFAVGKARSGFWSLESVRAEVAKCDVLCANCHLKLHARERAAKLEPLATE